MFGRPTCSARKVSRRKQSTFHALSGSVNLKLLSVRATTCVCFSLLHTYCTHGARVFNPCSGILLRRVLQAPTPPHETSHRQARTAAPRRCRIPAASSASDCPTATFSTGTRWPCVFLVLSAVHSATSTNIHDHRNGSFVLWRDECCRVIILSGRSQSRPH